LRALHRIKPQPKANPGSPPHPTQDMGPLSGASGFVGMLAKGQLEDKDGSRVLPPVAESSRRAKYKLPMAKEIAPPGQNAGNTANEAADAEQPVEPASQSDQRAQQNVPRWYKPALPMLFVLAVVLAIIGVWAVGAIAYMQNTTPLASTDVHYPLIRWSLDAGDRGNYTESSRLIAWVMLICLPVSAVFLALALMTRKRLKRARKSPR
jgi:hypothetical protein